MYTKIMALDTVFAVILIIVDCLWWFMIVNDYV